MSAPTPGTRPDVEALLFLVAQAERGPLLPIEADLLREAVRDMDRYRRWCEQWSDLHMRLRRTAAQRLRALRRALVRAQHGRAVEAELARVRAEQVPTDPQQYEQLLAAQLLDGWTVARAAARLDPVTRRHLADVVVNTANTTSVPAP
ncbi:hypothetical protein [Kitasatospora phosalacinea]|uniref:Uncharacterized protein n=1 Tax=Kitasatospora phosalacinea TaxID=2065 RepID=A0A9W6UN61_9ACTN|nr:hypothetical protein [Kitasatospora phosalacinea]GLW53953.1 hypothetical protein Kpho01_19640 [Kitasatospora phosalacinea]